MKWRIEKKIKRRKIQRVNNQERTVKQEWVEGAELNKEKGGKI